MSCRASSRSSASPIRERPCASYDNSAREIAERVQKGEAEFGITILGTSRWDLEIKPLVKEPFVLICPASHAFAGATLAELVAA